MLLGFFGLIKSHTMKRILTAFLLLGLSLVTNAQSNKLVIGSWYQGGIIVNIKGGHGFVVATDSPGVHQKISLDDFSENPTNGSSIVRLLWNQNGHNGYQDWRIPTKEELNLIYKNLCSKGLVVAQASKYFSSDQYSNDFESGVCAQDFTDGKQIHISHLERGYNVGVRSF